MNTSSGQRRFKRPQVAGSSSNARRRRSVSPEGAAEDGPNRTDSNVLRKKKKGTMQSLIAAAIPSQSRSQRASASGGESAEVARRPNGRHPPTPEDGADPQSSRRPQKSKRRERSQSRDATRRASIKADSADEAGVVEQMLFGNTTSDYERVKEELDTMKKHVSAAKKTISRQNKAIEDLRKDLAHSQQSHHEERQQVELLKTKHRKTEEVISTIEANMNCQICMDILMKPYGLAPCGHVLCLHCLQSWFRAAPPGEDAMHDDPDDLLFRKKTCPVCRAAVRSRPIPLFLVKAIASALEKSKQPDGASVRSSPAPEGDPWEGIFPELRPNHYMDEDDEYDPYGYADDDDIFPDEYYSDDDDDEEYLDAYDAYGSEVEDDEYEGEWVQARWAPPTVHVPPEHYPFDNISHETLAMLRRGATQPMIELFHMSYSHDEGLRAIIGENVVFLGWNIHVRPDDEEGELFMEWIEADVYNHPERWDREDTVDGTWIAWRLVREDDDEVEYDNTDSEAYEVEDDDDDDDYD